MMKRTETYPTQPGSSKNNFSMTRKIIAINLKEFCLYLIITLTVYLFYSFVLLFSNPCLSLSYEDLLLRFFVSPSRNLYFFNLPYFLFLMISFFIFLVNFMFIMIFYYSNETLNLNNDLVYTLLLFLVYENNHFLLFLLFLQLKKSRLLF